MSCDLLVVGAGVAGAFTAARYQQFFPEDIVCIVERSVTVGGRLRSLPLARTNAASNGADESVGSAESEYQAELGGMRYFKGVHTLVPAALEQLGLDTTELPYVNADGLAYLRGKLIPLRSLGEEIGSVYNLKPDEVGLSPDALYNKTITKVLQEHNLSFDDVLSNQYMVNHTMFNVLRDANLSSEAISAYTDTAGYEWVLGSNAAIVAQEDLEIEGWGLQETFVKTGFQSLVTSLIDLTDAARSNKTNLFLSKSVTALDWTDEGVVAEVTNVAATPVGASIARPLAPATTITAKRAVLTSNNIQLLAMAEWPWDVKQLIYDVEQIETVKIFIRFSTSWWSKVLTGLGRSVTTLPLRQVWAYAPNVLMIYGDSNNARFWKPYLEPVAGAVPGWVNVDEVPELTEALFTQLSEMFGVPKLDIQLASQDVAFAYWNRCTAFWRAGSNIEGNIARSTQPMSNVPIHFASDIWSSKQGWVEGALHQAEAVLKTIGVPSIMDHPLPPAANGDAAVRRGDKAHRASPPTPTRGDGRLLFDA